MVGRAGYNNDAERIWCRKEVCIDNTVERSLIAAFMRAVAEKLAFFQVCSSWPVRAVLKCITPLLDQLEHHVPALKGLKLGIIDQASLAPERRAQTNATSN